MDSIRELVERYYEDTRDSIFNDHSGLDAHEIFVKQARLLRSLKLDRLLFHHSDFKRKKTFELSNAAGFNKDGLIPPQFLHYLGFDRVVVGTVTADPWPGNNPIIIQRYPETKSMVNWMGLPGVGADQVGETLDDYGNHGVPITINVMATPGKSLEEQIDDISYTVEVLSDVEYVDRFTLNISCPNTHEGDRDHNKQHLGTLLDAVFEAKDYQELYVKVSPDSTIDDVSDTLAVVSHYKVKGFVIGNTTSNRDRKFIDVPPYNNDGVEVGGASGDAVYDRSLKVQQLYHEQVQTRKLPYDIIACGGISTPERVKERLSAGASGIQVFTPLIFQGPRLLRELR